MPEGQSAITKMFSLPVLGGLRAPKNTTDIRLPHIASRLFNNPLAITEDKLQDILAFFVPRIEGREGASREEIAEFFESTSPSRQNEDKAALEGPSFRGGTDPGFDVMTTSNGNIAVVPIAGTLVQRGAWVRESSGMTSYQGIRQSVSNALLAANVDALLLHVNSPGGEVFGCFDLAASLQSLVQNADQRKPIYTFTDGLLASASYALGCVSERVYGDMTSIAGSIGVITVHVDMSKFNDERGIKITQLAVGARKTDGSPSAPLSDAARTSIMSRLEATNDVFVNHVVAARPALTRETIMNFEAGVFVGQHAVDLGLVDGIKTFGQVVESMQERMQTIKDASKGQTQVATQLADTQAVEEVETQAAVAAVPAVDQDAGQLNDDTKGEVDMAETNIAKLETQVGELTGQIGALLESHKQKDAKIDALLNMQNSQAMREFVVTKLRYLPGDAAHVTSVLLRLNDVDVPLCKEVSQLLVGASAVMEKTSQITTSIGQYGHQQDTALAESDDGRVRIEKTVPMEAFKAEVAKHRASHPEMTELGAWDAVALEQPDMYTAIKNAQAPAPEVVVAEGPAQTVGADAVAAAPAVPVVDSSVIGAEYLVGAGAGPDL